MSTNSKDLRETLNAHHKCERRKTFAEACYWLSQYKELALRAVLYAEYADRQLEHLRSFANDITLKYEELRKLIDGGSESMTHADAVTELKALLIPRPNEIGLGKGEFVIWPVNLNGIHGLAFVKDGDPKAVGTYHAEPEDGRIELGSSDSVIYFGNAESALVLAERLQYVIALLQSAPQPVAYGIDDEAARRIALAVHDYQNRISDEPLLYAINRILIKEAHPLSAEGLAEVQSAPQESKNG